MKINQIIETQLDEIDRRGFLRGLGAAGAAAMVPGIAKAKAAASDEELMMIAKKIKSIFAKSIVIPAPIPAPTSAGRFRFTFDLQGRIIKKEQVDSSGDTRLDQAVLNSATNITPDIVALFKAGPDDKIVRISFGVGDGWWKAGIQNGQNAQSQLPTQTQNQQDTLYGNIKIGMSIEEIIKNNPGIKADDQWSSAGIAGTMSDYLGVDSPKSRIKAAGTIKGPYGSDAKIFILTNKNLQCNGVVIWNEMAALPENWLEDHGTLFGFNKGEFITFLKKVVSNIPQSMGSKIGKLRTREDGGMGLSGGFGAAIPVGKNGSFGVGVGMAKQGVVAVTQKLANKNIDSNMIIFAGTIAHQMTGVNALRPVVIFTLQDKSAVVPDLDIE